MSSESVRRLLTETEQLALSVGEPFRVAAFQTLLTAGLNGQLQEQSITTARKREMTSNAAENISGMLRLANSKREQIAVITYAGDSDRNGLTMAEMRATFQKYRERLPANLSRDISVLVRAGIILQLSGDGRDTRFGLAAQGMAIVDRLAGVRT